MQAWLHDNHFSTDWPPSYESIKAFVQFLHLAQHTTYFGQLTGALNLLSRLHNTPNPLREDRARLLFQQVNLVEKGEGSAPILPAQACHLYLNGTDPSWTPIAAQTWRAFIGLAWAGMFRFSELHNLRAGDCEHSEDQITLRFQSKTSRQSGRKHVVILTPDMDRFLPTFSLLTDLLRSHDRQRPVGDRYLLRGCPALQSNQTLNRRMRELLPTSEVTSHGFRSGAVGLALASGIDGDLIRLLGRWSPDSKSWEAHYGAKARPIVPLVRYQLEKLLNVPFESLIPNIRRFLRA